MGLNNLNPVFLNPCMYTVTDLLYYRTIFVYDTFETHKCFPFAIENELAHIRKHNKMFS